MNNVARFILLLLCGNNKHIEQRLIFLLTNSRPLTIFSHIKYFILLPLHNDKLTFEHLYYYNSVTTNVCQLLKLHTSTIWWYWDSSIIDPSATKKYRSATESIIVEISVVSTWNLILTVNVYNWLLLQF